ncbi:related to Autophagy protein 5 [Ramularia collo-cygni]|uniref:Autophagy protein 5 n=1 Tax=Ramularia collo-cygni TaxID=112498 RepID=A0A2D3V966_9PEZI|nr:related to Autophagy protein 5 [Ramularia collo-cygni]CZT18049.1 related to Autophagy protein 5 [Ramularia collo-cygni]
MPIASKNVTSLQSKIWSGSLPLEIKLAAPDCRSYDESETYLVQRPRLSYLAFLLPRLHAFFAPSLIDPAVSSHDAWFSFEDVPLKWHYPIGLLYDLFSGAEPLDLDSSPGIEDPTSQTTVEPSNGVTPIPWKLTIHYSELPLEHLLQLDEKGKTMQDVFINNVKEADFIRNGTARTVMSLGKDDSDNLWSAVQNHDLALFNSVNNKLLNPPGMELRHVPIKLYLPTSANSAATDTIPEETTPGHLRVVQSLIPLLLPTKQPQTLGTALNKVLPSIFPSRRSPIYARPVLHGAAVPLAARMDELGRAAAYTDGFLHVAVVMHG